MKISLTNPTTGETVQVIENVEWVRTVPLNNPNYSWAPFPVYTEPKSIMIKLSQPLPEEIREELKFYIIEYNVEMMGLEISSYAFTVQIEA